MKPRSIKYICLFVILLAAGLAGCKKLLTEKPSSFLTTDQFYKTSSDAELAITGVYEILNAVDVQGNGNQPMWGATMQYLTTMGCDEQIGDVTFLAGQPNFLSLCNYTYTSENTLLWYTYAALYAGINRANFVIERVPSIDMDTTRRGQIVAEARFFRGLYYSYLGWLWGGVPLADSSVVSPTAPRASMQQIVQHAMADFSYAYNRLPARNKFDGRVNKYTAEGFLAKLNLYIASCKENNVGQSLSFPLNSFDWVDAPSAYQQALQYCQDIYTNSGYTLLKPFNYLFLAATKATARSEHMMIVQTGPGGNQENIVYSYLAGPAGAYNTTGGTYGWVRPVREGYNRFNSNDGRRSLSFSGAMPTSATTTPFETIGGYKYFIPSAIVTNLSNMSICKWRLDNPVDRINRGVPNWAGDIDWGVLRYGDVLLMFAEAKYKTGDETGARSLFSELRTRAVAGDLTKLNTITTAYRKTDFMQELLDERSRELLGEGWRRFDLIRTGKLKSVIAAMDNSAMFPREDVKTIQSNFADNKIWYPLPSREISTNSNLVQNAGY